MESLVSRNELRRLEKAVKDKDKVHMADWIKAFEDQIQSMMRLEYENKYQDEIQCSVQNMLTAIVFTLYYSEETIIDRDNIGEVMEKLYNIFDFFSTGKYKPKDYKDKLAEAGIYIEDFDLDWVYKKYLNIFDSDLVKFLKSERRKIITICGDSKYKEEILRKAEEYTLRGYMVFTRNVFFNPNEELLDEEKFQIEVLQKDKILISDAIFVYNKDKYIDGFTELEIGYAKEHNKDVIYLEEIEEK